MELARAMHDGAPRGPWHPFGRVHLISCRPSVAGHRTSPLPHDVGGAEHVHEGSRTSFSQVFSWIQLIGVHETETKPAILNDIRQATPLEVSGSALPAVPQPQDDVIQLVGSQDVPDG